VSIVRITNCFVRVFAFVCAASASLPALAGDLQLTDYSYAPDPVANGSPATFTIRVTNNGPGTINNAVVTIAVSDRFSAPTTFPSGCTVSGGGTTLTCNLDPLLVGAGNSQTFTYVAPASTVGSSNTTATISASGNTGNITGNDSLTITPTVRQGADLSLVKTASAASIPAGAPLNYTLTASNAGPNVSSAVRIVDNLPAATDYQYLGFSGTGWTCALGGTTVTCNYSGAAIIGAYPSVTINGKAVKNVNGTVTNIATVQSSSSLILDGNGANDTTPGIVTTITTGSDLQAIKSMPSVITIGETVNITLSIRNDGPQNVPAGSTISDVIDASLTIGAMPSGCVRAGQSVTCTAGALTPTGQSNFLIPVTGASATAGVLTNTATIAAPAGFTDADPANNGATAPFRVVPANANLELYFKTKIGVVPVTVPPTPTNPVAPGQDILSAIGVRNLGPSIANYSPANPIRVTDQLSINENLQSLNPPGWSCAQVGTLITCQTTGTGTLAVNSVIGLDLITRATAGFDGTITNTACTDRTASSGHTPSDVTSITSDDCVGAGVRSTNQVADLRIIKEVSLSSAGPWTQTPAININDTDTSFYIRLTAANLSGNTARTVLVEDSLPNDVNDNGQTTAVSTFSTTSGTVAYNAGTGITSWSLTNLAVSSTETAILKIDRPFNSGSFTNNASIYSPDTTDNVISNNQSSADYSVVSLADMTVNNKSITPDPARVGVNATYIISVRNAGANPANNVIVTDTIDPTRWDIIGTPTTTKSGGTCTVTTATGAISCTMGTFTRAESFQIEVIVRAKYPFGGTILAGFPVNYTNRARVTTTTTDSNGGSDGNAGNNFFDVTHGVSAPAFDLAVTKQESNPANDDPVRFDETLNYDVRASNFGPSRATDVVVTDLPNPPPGLTMTLTSVVMNPVAANSGLTLQAAPNGNCAAAGATYVCKIDPSSVANNFLDPEKQVIFRMVFAMGGTPPSTVTSFSNEVRITSAEQPVYNTAGADTNLPNNVAIQTTTVLPSTDLEVVSKVLNTPSPIFINQTANYTIRIRNNGPSSTNQVRVTDTLPTGFILTTPAPTTSIPGGSTATVSALNCTGTSTVLCVIDGSFPGNVTDTVDLIVNVRPDFPYTGPLDPSDATNTASIAPGQDTALPPNVFSEDSVSTNNSKSANVRVQNASISGRVFADNNRNTSFQVGEGLGGVTLTLSGTDVNGFQLPANITATTAADGTYTFPNLPPSNGTGYTVTQTQPGGYFTFGQQRGTIDGSAVGVDTVANVISGIVLNPNKDSINNDFREIQQAQLSGYIYRDLNNDGTRLGGTETGFAPAAFASAPQLRLTGTDYAGNAVNLTAAVDSTGFYQFTGLAPSDTTTGYIVTQLVNPTNTSDGLDTNGTGAVIAGSRTTDVINAGVVNANDNLTERNFGELPTSTLTGFVYFDPNNNATKDGSENAGLAGATITLTGTNDLAQSITCVITTDPTGAYSFPGGTGANCTVLRPGAYTVTETPPPGLTHTGAYIGSAGGTVGATTGTNVPAVGTGNTVISAITIASGVNATNYNFGESGQGLIGSVYIDANNNGKRDAGEVGIPGVTILASGTTATGQNVCTIVTCAQLTDSSGNFEYLNFPGSNSTGYTLTEQSHTSAPLTQFVDGQDAAGGLGTVVRGTAANDVISGIVIGGGEMLTNYQFGEIASSLAGRVYIDNDDSGSFNGSEIGISGVQITLSGNTLSGQNVCAYLAALTPTRSCVATTVGDGTYAFANLPAGNYTLTESQPSAYLDGRETAGSSGGTPADNVISAITLASGTASINNLFGERAVSLSGYVFKDPQRDGTDGGSEPRIAGVVIILRNSSGVEIGRTTTGTDGGFAFNNLPAGSYTIEEVQPLGYGSSTPNSATVTLTAGGTQIVRFGETVSSIAGNVFVDGSDDGVRQSPAERGIPNTVITLSGTDAASGTVNRTVNTGADGAYVFEDVLAGTYVLTETQPATYADGKDSAGSANGTVANDAISAIALPAATDAISYNFGERGQGLAGIVYDDLNRNGRADPSDTPIVGVIIQLQDTNGVVIATTTTGADGRYSFPDIEAGSYVLVQIQPDGYGDAAQNPSNRVPFTVVAGTRIDDIDFGERTGSIAGLVYNDSNSNSQRDSNEPVIPGVTITLTGTDARGNPVNQITTTDSTGAYRFVGLPGGSYTITETQPAAFNDAAETLGSAGGTVASDAFTLTLPPAQDATGYLFGERGDVGQINGTVWFDKNHDRVRNGGEEVKADWAVQLWLGDTTISSTTTDANGRYGFSNIVPGTGYRIRFISPEGIIFGGARTNEANNADNPGKATLADGEITNITLAPGGTVPNQSLPLDPAGVVYDSVRRVPVENARVTITGPTGFNPALHLLGGLANVTQTVGADGFYQYLLAPSAPAGIYNLSVTPPNGTYNPLQPSTIIPPCVGALTAGPTPDPNLVSLIDGAPPLGTTQYAPNSCVTNTASTAYYLSFNLNGQSADVINNNIPIDPILKGAIQVIKTTPLVNVSRGQLVPYTVVARNTLQGTLTGITITDRVPAGFQYKDGSARLNGEAAEPVRQGRLLNWIDQRFTAREEKRYDLLLVVGSGVKEGEHTNEAYALNAIVNTVVSDVATATVRLVPDPDFDCTDIIGKVFDDQNANGIQDENEPGLPGVRLATARGLLITTDQFGRYHITCPMIANEERGSNFILKLDDRTLPTGYRITTMNPETVRLTRGKFAKLNFGASLHRIVRVDVSANAFSGNEVAESYREQVKRLATILAERPSVLRIGYGRTNESNDVVDARVNALIKYLRECWKEDGDRYRLTIEKETMRLESQAKGDVK
jgi:large repetitive protein